MKKSLAAAGIALTLILTGCGAGGSPKEADRIEEDDPRWDCHAMGNHVCGEDFPRGVVLVNPDDCPLYVTACYDHLTPWTKGK